MRRRHFIAASAAALAAPWSQAATELPKGIVKIYVGWAPGGGTDVFARIVGQKLSDLWGRGVIIENKPGATGALAAGFFAQTRFTEGLNLLMAHVNTHAIGPHIFKAIPYDPLKDFMPIAPPRCLGATPHILVTSANRPGAATVKEVVDECRKNRGKISFGSSGTGSVQHLCAAMFNMAAGVETIHIPYKGSGQRAPSVASTGPRFDTMTTMDEQGFRGFDVSSWNGVVGPKGMSHDLAAQMNADINKVLAMPDPIARFEGLGVADADAGSTSQCRQRDAASSR